MSDVSLKQNRREISSGVCREEMTGGGKEPRPHIPQEQRPALLSLHLIPAQLTEGSALIRALSEGRGSTQEPPGDAAEIKKILRSCGRL